MQQTGQWYQSGCWCEIYVECTQVLWSDFMCDNYDWYSCRKWNHYIYITWSCMPAAACISKLGVWSPEPPVVTDTPAFIALTALQTSRASSHHRHPSLTALPVLIALPDLVHFWYTFGYIYYAFLVHFWYTFLVHSLCFFCTLLVHFFLVHLVCFFGALFVHLFGTLLICFFGTFTTLFLIHFYCTFWYTFGTLEM